MDKYYARTRVNFVQAYPLKITAFQLMMLIDYYYYLLTELKTEKFIQTSFGLVEIVPGRVYKRQSVNVLFWGFFCHFVLLINSIECFSVPLIVVLSKRVVSASKSSQLYRVIMNLQLQRFSDHRHPFSSSQWAVTKNTIVLLKITKHLFYSARRRNCQYFELQH